MKNTPYIFSVLIILASIPALAGNKCEMDSVPTVPAWLSDLGETIEKQSLIHSKLITFSGNFKARNGSSQLSYAYRGELRNISSSLSRDALHRFDYVDNNETEKDIVTLVKSMPLDELNNTQSLFSLVGMHIITIKGSGLKKTGGDLVLSIRKSFVNPFNTKRIDIPVKYNHSKDLTSSTLSYYDTGLKAWLPFNHVHLELVSPDAMVPSGISSVSLQVKNKAGATTRTTQFK